MKNIQTLYGWRDPPSEREDRPMVYSSGRIDYPCRWHECPDPGMEGELVLVYCLERTTDPKKTFLRGGFLQTLTASGKKCSGRVGKFVKEAIPGTYNEDGTYRLNGTI